MIRDATSGFKGISDILKNQPISSRGARRDWVTVLGRPERQVVLVIRRPADGAGDDPGRLGVCAGNPPPQLPWARCVLKRQVQLAVRGVGFVVVRFVEPQ